MQDFRNLRHCYENVLNVNYLTNKAGSEESEAESTGVGERYMWDIKTKRQKMEKCSNDL